MADEEELLLQVHRSTPIFDGLDEFRFSIDNIRCVKIRPRRTAEAEHIEHVQRMACAEKIDVLDPYAARTTKIVNEHDRCRVTWRVQTADCPNHIVTPTKCSTFLECRATLTFTYRIRTYSPWYLCFKPRKMTDDRSAEQTTYEPWYKRSSACASMHGDAAKNSFTRAGRNQRADPALRHTREGMYRTIGKVASIR